MKSEHTQILSELEEYVSEQGSERGIRMAKSLGCKKCVYVR